MNTLKKALFIDRDGTIITEPADEQIDSLEKLTFVPGAISGLKALAGLDFELVLATNQDGLGTDSFPEATFWPAHEKMLATLGGEGIRFDDALIDRTFERDNAPTRKPRTGMFTRYLNGAYDLSGSYVIGDRVTDLQLARNLGARGILLRPAEEGRRMAEQAGVKFRFNTPVDQLLCDGEQIYGVKCGDEVIKADAYVMAFGSYSTAMLKGIVDIPVYPLKGYSLTIPIAQEDGAPVSTILDETYKIAITRFDNRIRVGGMAEIVGFNTELLQPRRETLEMVVRDLYHAAVMSSRRLSGLVCAR